MRCIFWWEWVIPSALCACGAFLTISFRCAYKIYSLSNQWFSSHPTWHKTKTDQLGRFVFWWSCKLVRFFTYKITGICREFLVYFSTILRDFRPYIKKPYKNNRDFIRYFCSVKKFFKQSVHNNVYY